MNSTATKVIGMSSGDYVPTIHFSVVILTYNRQACLRHVLSDLATLRYPSIEVIVVDNNSEIPATVLQSEFPNFKFLKSNANIGTAARNIGFMQASGEYIVSLDDDLYGLTDQSLEALYRYFQDPKLGAVCFKVIEEATGTLTNWVHHRPAEVFENRSFPTYEITEGAVAFRKEAVARAGYYPETFFISHEGPDLAFRILDLGYEIVYVPDVSVVHSYSPHGRASWRNYYYDTRNTFWLVFRNCPFGFGSRLLIRQTGAMFIYSCRDGFFRWWLKGVYDGLLGLPEAIQHRRKMGRETMKRIWAMESDRPGLMYLIRRRLFQRGIKL